MRISIIACIALLFFLSCANNRLVKDIEQFMNRQIVLSADWDAVYKGRDTVLTDFLEVPIKLVVWYDSLGCGSCEVGKMHEWNKITAYADSLAPWFSIVYLFTPSRADLRSVDRAVRIDKFDYPVFIDKDAAFIRQNPKLPKNRRLHSFLLDKNNKVVMVGNPLHNPTLWALYKTTIQKMMDNNGVLPEQ
ncbi:MAG: hypothetical protein FWE99_04505 [Bacteroidales bacterium]|nr:hypothetical protein [Bacteroidales bacterium]